MFKKLILAVSLLVLPVTSNAVTLGDCCADTFCIGLMLRAFRGEAVDKASDLFLSASIAYFAIICAKNLFEVREKESLDKQLDDTKMINSDNN